MQSDIADKNSKIAQLNTVNVKLSTQNNYLTELCAKDRRFEKVIEREEGEVGNKRKRGNKTTGEYNGQEKRQRFHQQERRYKIKCQWHENGGCMKEVVNSATQRYAETTTKTTAN